MSLPASLQELVEQLKKLPGVGAKSASGGGKLTALTASTPGISRSLPAAASK